jgi:ribosome-binding protein aMBF1 (putative translation factor)
MITPHNQRPLYATILYKHRKWHGLTQAALGDFLGYSAKVIQRMETGERVPMEAECIELQEVLGIKHNALLEACRVYWFQDVAHNA